MSSPQTDEARWFAEEVQLHGSQLKSYLRDSFPAVHDVDDVVQESFLRIWKARASHPIRSAKSFLFTVARRVAIDLLRRQATSPVIALPDLTALPVMEERPGAAESACRSDELVLLAQAIRSLPSRCREVIILRQIEGVSQKEIARRLGISELTVQTHVVHGLRRLETCLRRHSGHSLRS